MPPSSQSPFLSLDVSQIDLAIAKGATLHAGGVAYRLVEPGAAFVKLGVGLALLVQLDQIRVFPVFTLPNDGALFGFREATVADAEVMVVWLRDHAVAHSRDPKHLAAALKMHCRTSSIASNASFVRPLMRRFIAQALCTSVQLHK